MSVEVQGRYGGLLRSAVVAVDPLDVSGGGEHVGGLPRSVDHGFEEVDGAGDPVVDDGAGAAEETLQAAVEEVDACPPVGGWKASCFMSSIAEMGSAAASHRGEATMTETMGLQQ